MENQELLLLELEGELWNIKREIVILIGFYF